MKHNKNLQVYIRQYKRHEFLVHPHRFYKWDHKPDMYLLNFVKSLRARILHCILRIGSVPHNINNQPHIEHKCYSSNSYHKHKGHKYRCLIITTQTIWISVCTFITLILVDNKTWRTKRSSLSWTATADRWLTSFCLCVKACSWITS